jgi:hypothetical protein
VDRSRSTAAIEDLEQRFFYNRIVIASYSNGIEQDAKVVHPIQFKPGNGTKKSASR